MSNLFSYLVNSSVTAGLLKITQHNTYVISSLWIQVFNILAVLLRYIYLFIPKLKNTLKMARNIKSTNSYTNIAF